MGLGVALLQGFGTFSFQVSDVQQFVTQIVGAQGMLRSAPTHPVTVQYDSPASAGESER
jgi:hypothetical protein